MQQVPVSAQLIIENLRPVLALGFAGFALSMLLTPIYTGLAYRFEWWKKQRTTATSGENASVFQKLHAKKHRRNIPTMAGMIALTSFTLVTLLWNLDRGQTWLPLFAAVGAGLLGLLDDVINLRSHNGGLAGLNTKLKFLIMVLISAALGYWFVYKLGYNNIHVPFIGDVAVAGGLLMAIIIFVIVATANAVNITDGLDGLAGGLLAAAFASFGLLAILQGNVGIAGFCLTVVGTLLSYVWFNIYPARFFMGDIGSFAFGTALAVVAIMLNAILLVPIIGAVFVLEVGSSSLQLLSKRLFGKKIFRSAPVHHHLEALGWPETKVTMRFWVLGQIAAVVGLLVAILGGHVTI